MPKILVIEDSDLVARLLKNALNEAGYETLIATDGSKGFVSASEFHPDLIVLDVHLPDVLGFDVVRELKTKDVLKNVPIIMMSGTHQEPKHRERALQAGVSDYVLKPFEIDDLVQRVGLVLARSGISAPAGSPLVLPIQPAPPNGHVTESPAPIPKPEIRASAPPPSTLSSVRPVAVPARNNPSTTSFPMNDISRAFFSVSQYICKSVYDPWRLPKELVFPRLALTYLFTALALTLLGVAFTAGSPIKPVIAVFWVLGTWGAAVATLVITCSIMGLHLNWKDGASLVSTAGIPILLKMLGAVFSALVTGLSPFYYTFGPALLWKGAPWIVGRLDLFELWSLFLFWLLIRQHPGETVRRSAIVTSLVWLVCAAMTFILMKLLASVHL